MFRGFLSGVAFGIIVGAVLMAVISLMGPPPVGREPPLAPQVQAPSDAGTGATEATANAPAAPDAGAVPAIGGAPQVSTPDPAGARPLADTSSGGVPAASGVEGDLGQPGAPQTQQPVIDADSPVALTSPGASPITPLTETSPAINSTPAEAPAPEMLANAPEPAAVPSAASGGDGIALDQPPLPAPTPMGVEGPLPDSQPTPGETTAPLQAPAAPDQIASAPEAAAPAPAEPEVVVIAPERPEVGLSGSPALTMPTGDGSVTIRRPGSDTDTENESEPRRTALDLYASDFTPTGRPLMGIILLDEGKMAGGPDALAASGVPVTVAIDPTLPGGTALMTAYRDRGIEVLAMIDLPANALPVDVEVAIAAIELALPEAIGVLDVTGAGVPDAAATQTQVMAALSGEGLGFVTASRGLNSSVRAAQTANVPHATLYRDLDSSGQDARVIRRFLDQAAFKARQESGVVMLGRVRPETISALILWSTANRSTDVEQAPVSAILLNQN